MKILIIEDDINIANILYNNFINNSHLVDTASNGIEGSYLARINYYDLIIVDYSLPQKNGLDVCSEIRAFGSNSLIIFLSMNQSIHNKVSCLEAGADDYMTKPFAFEELYARIKALMRRPKKIENSILTANDLTMDTKTKIVKRGQVFIYLTKTEYNLLEFFIRNKGLVLSRGAIMEHIWSARSDPLSNTVETHLGNLRRKLYIKNRPDIIRNVTGRGYVVDE